MAKALINRIKLHYQVKGEGPDVILIHGITSCLAQWYVEILPQLSREYRVTTYDLRGHGLSEMTSGGYDSYSMASDLDALMNHLGIERAYLVGHSFGGAIALHQALLRPDRVSGVVLLDTGLACLRHLRVVEDWTGWKTYGADLAQFGITLPAFLEIDRQQDVTEVIRRSLSIPVQSGFRKGQSGLTPRLKRLLDETRMGTEFREVAGLTQENLAKVHTPVLAIYGGASPYVKMAEHLSRALPNCRYELLHDAGHFYAVEEPALVLDRLNSFIRNPAGYVDSLPAGTARSA
jgi:3-oxoadipate enol-lactonase